MAIDAYVNTSQLDSDLTSIANTIRDRRDLPSSNKLLFPSDFISQIEQINPYDIDGPKNIISNGIFNAHEDSKGNISTDTCKILPIVNSVNIISIYPHSFPSDSILKQEKWS